MRREDAAKPPNDSRIYARLSASSHDQQETSRRERIVAAARVQRPASRRLFYRRPSIVRTTVECVELADDQTTVPAEIRLRRGDTSYLGEKLAADAFAMSVQQTSPGAAISIFRRGTIRSERAGFMDHTDNDMRPDFAPGTSRRSHAEF